MRRACDRPVEEVGIAEGDVLRAGLDLGADVGQHHLDRHDAELPVVDRHNRTVPAAMLAAAGGLGGADDGLPAVGPLQLARRRSSAGRPWRSGTRNTIRGQRRVVRRRQRHARLRLLRHLDEIGLGFGTEHRLHAGGGELRLVERRVQTVGADRQVGTVPSDGGNDRQRQARRGVHRQVHGRQRHARRAWPRSAARPTGRRCAPRTRRGAATRRAMPGRRAGGPVRRSTAEGPVTSCLRKGSR